LALVVLVGWIDFITGDLSVFLLYLIPICFCTWVLGRASGFFIALASALAALRADIAVRHQASQPFIPYDHPLVPYWNAFTLLIIFSVVVWLLWSLKQFQLNLEDKIKQRTADLLKANAELKTAQLRLIEADKLELIGRLAAGVAHEVKNPLMTITMAVDYFAQVIPPTEPDGPAMIEDMRGAVQRANRVISELLELSRPSDLSVQPEDFHAVTNHALDLVKLDLNRKHISVVRKFAAPRPVLPLDKNKIVQVLLNVFMNAIQAMPEGGTLTVATQALPKSVNGGSGILVEVDDTGSGISEANLVKLFEPFFTTKPTGQGTGLGLSVSRQIAKQHGGNLSLSNRPRGGVRATLELNSQSKAQL
jgi:signal transduction histidine kinase